MDFLVKPGGALHGSIRVPGDKSISHRAIMLGAIADGVTRVFGFLEGEDAMATLNAFRDLGVEIAGPHNGEVTIQGVGRNGLQPCASVDLGNSGTSVRLMAGLLAGQPFNVTMTGDVSLSKRPMGRVAEPLKLMGAEVQTNNGLLPMQVGGGKLHGIDYTLPVASAQIKSCLLLAGLYAAGVTTIREPAPTRDHTERMLRGFGYEVSSEDGVISLQGGGPLAATEIEVPADISSAAFFLVAASIAPGSDLMLEHVGINPTRTGVIDILKLMGADIELLNSREVGGEPVADIRVRAAQLKGVDCPEHLVPLAIDEFPVLFVAAACAQGQSRFSGLAELRVKESDRIQVMADGFAALGVACEVTEDGLNIEGGQAIGGGVIECHHDHRIAMAFAVAALRATGDISVPGCDSVNTSFPGFAALATGCGLNVQVQQ